MSSCDPIEVYCNEAYQLYPPDQTTKSSRRSISSVKRLILHTLSQLLHTNKAALLLDDHEDDANWPLRLLHICYNLQHKSAPWMAIVVGEDVILTCGSKVQELVEDRAQMLPLIVDARAGCKEPRWLEGDDCDGLECELLQQLGSVVETNLVADDGGEKGSTTITTTTTLTFRTTTTDGINSVWDLKLAANLCAVATVGWFLGYPVVYWVKEEDGDGCTPANNLSMVRLTLYRVHQDGKELMRFSLPTTLSERKLWRSRETYWREHELAGDVDVDVDQIEAQPVVGL